MRSFFQDLRYAIRTLVKSPGFAFSAALTLALGIAANAASFSVIDALLLRPYRVENPERLQLVYAREAGDRSGENKSLTFADHQDLTSQNRIFDVLAAARFSDFNLSGSVQPERAEGYYVEPALFTMLEARALHGRVFGPEDSRPGEEGAILLSEPLWKSRFAGDPSIIGKSIRVNGRRCRVVGIMPQQFHYPLGAQVWVPLSLTPAEKTERTRPRLLVLGRLRSDVSASDARHELQSFSAGLQRLYPQTNAHRDFTLLPLRQEQYDYSLSLFSLVQIAAAFVLALAAANVCGILIARALTRETETAIRAALGARSWDLFRATMAEVLLLGALGAAIGIALGGRAVDAIRAGMPPGISIWLAGWYQLRLTGRAVLVSSILTVAVSFAIASLLTLRGSRRTVEDPLRPALSSRGGSRSGHRALSLLAVSQVALAAALLASAGLLVVGFRRVITAFESHAPENLLTFDLHLPPGQYAGAAAQSAFVDRVLERLSALPGVSATAGVRNAPASNVDNPTVRFEIEGQAAPRESDLPTSGLQAASPGYLRAFQVPLMAGRDFNVSDGPGGSSVALVSRAVARKAFPNGDAVGRRIRIRIQGTPGSWTTPGGWTTVVGIVEDVRQNWFDLEPPPCIYLPLDQSPRESVTIALRTQSDPRSLAPAVRAAVGQLDPDLPLGTLGSFRDRIIESVAPVRIIGLLLAVFGITALALAMVGVYGVTAQAVSRRRHELGIRVALGAAPRGLLAGVLARAFRLTLAGLCLALPLVYISARLLASRVFGLVAPDGRMLAAVFVSLLFVSAAAALLPALRATRVDPAEALRLP
jgi:predicted permease